MLLFRVVQSDYLDTSNPLRLLAFFKYMDVANMQLDFDNPEVPSMAREFLKSIYETYRQRAIHEAIALFNGGEFKALPVMVAALKSTPAPE
jgi:hypothetical protein